METQTRTNGANGATRKRIGAPVITRTDKTRGERREIKFSSEVERVTPTMAAKWLEDTETVENFRNRGISEGNVAIYKENMIRGTWEVNHQGIALFEYSSDKWIVLDGQHRLWAVISAEIPVNMNITRYRGSPEDAVAVMQSFDRGQKRNLGQVLKIGKNIDRGSTRAAACRYLVAFLRGGGQAEARYFRLTDAEVISAVERYQPDLDWLVTLKRTAGNVFLSAPVGAALIYSHSTPHAEAVERFGRQLAGGEGIYAGDPALTFRDWVLNKGSDNLLRRPEGRMLFMRIAFKAIHRAVTGEKVKRFEDGTDGFEFFRKAKAK